MATQIKARKRAGTYAAFERRYGPIENENGELIRDWRDVTDADERYIWTVVDCDGKLYLVPGFATVNYFGRVLCANPWPDSEFTNTGYVY